jgi:hypothetical protein
MLDINFPTTTIIFIILFYIILTFISLIQSQISGSSRNTATTFYNRDMQTLKIID